VLETVFLKNTFLISSKPRKIIMNFYGVQFMPQPLQPADSAIECFAGMSFKSEG
jgi:hypothetical protein